jgi:GT2 family glycosyltransferase
MKAMPKTCAVVLSWNRRDDTLECLKALRQVEGQNFRILLVDNASSDGTVEAVADRFANVEILRNGSNLGFAGGCNAGIRRALASGAETVFLLNNDVIAEPDVLKLLAEDAAPFVDYVIGARVYSQSANAAPEFLGAIWDPKCADFRIEKQEQPENGARETAYAPGCALYFNTRLVKKIGMFDERFFLIWEETDFCWRARRAGAKVLISGRARVQHKGSASFEGGSWGKTYRYYFVRNRLLWIEKNLSGVDKITAYRACFRDLMNAGPLFRVYARASFDYLRRSFGPMRGTHA